MLIDLNARRAARAKATNDPVNVSVGDESFELVPFVRLAVVDALNEGDIVAASKALLAYPDRDWKAFAQAVTVDDIGDIIGSYGADPGESSASTLSSENTGEPSGPTSDTSTDSTSPPAATAPTP